MWLQRIQYAIGQGSFHGAGIYAGSNRGTAASPAFTYVYDCGSDQMRPLGLAIDRFAARYGNVDALFVSHLDRDHVSGIDHLLSVVDVDTVYIPYLDNTCLLLDLIEAAGSSELSGSLLEVSLNPAAWFGRRGVRRVIRVQAGSPEEPGEVIPPGPSPETEPESSKIVAEITPKALTVRSGAREGVRAELCEMSSGSSIVLWNSVGQLDWVLMPHVTPAPQENILAFIKAVKVALNIGSSSHLTTARLLKGLTESETRKKIKNAYDSIIAHGAKRMHNRISMSLYSGPINYENQTRWRHAIRRWQHNRFWPNLNAKNNGPVGWLGTGDSTLKVDVVWGEFCKAYRQFSKNVVTLSLPHHGSVHNFKDELIEFLNLKNAVASASIPSQYGHPSPYVFQQLQKGNVRTYLVSQKPYSELEEVVWLMSGTTTSR